MNWQSWLIGIFRSMGYGTPLLIATSGEIYSERSGVLNLGVEGVIAFGAFVGFAITFQTSNPWLGLMSAGLAGGLISLIHAFLSITLRANQVISGLALTMIGTGLAGLFGRGWEGTPLPFLARRILLTQNNFIFFTLILALLLWFFLFKTRVGISIRATGENPAAADASGINVWRIRYWCVFVGGVLAGIAGGYVSIIYRPAWTEGTTGGMGWLVIALTIFSFWNPIWAILGAYFFSAIFHLSFRLQAWIAPELLKSSPYILTIITLFFIGIVKLKIKKAPAALTQPYERGE